MSKSHLPKSHLSNSHSPKSRLPKSSTPKSRRASPKPSQPETPPFSAQELAATWFCFYDLCKHRACRRAARCSGGQAPPCFRAFWPLIEEREKVKFRTILKVRADGASASDAMAAGDAAAADYEKMMGPEAPAQSSPAQAQAAAEVPMPARDHAPSRPAARVRSL